MKAQLVNILPLLSGIELMSSGNKEEGLFCAIASVIFWLESIHRRLKNND